MSVYENVLSVMNALKEKSLMSEEDIGLLKDFEAVREAELELKGKKYKAYRVIHNRARGPGKGGIRFYEKLSVDELKTLAFLMSFKTALMELPFGGAKGGIKINAKKHSDKEKEEVSRAYVRAFYKYLGENKDVPAPDMYSNERIMGYMLDEYEKIKGEKEPAFITGKPIALGGLRLRKGATALGAYAIFKELCKDCKKKIIIHGFGSVGKGFAKLAYDDGHKIVAIADSRGIVFDDKGLDVYELEKIKHEKGSVSFYDAKKISEKEFLSINADALVLASLENTINESNASYLKAKEIYEIANAGISYRAEHILKDKLILPDLLINAGGVLASFFEWANNKGNAFIDEESLKKSFELKMLKAYYKVKALAEKESISYREAAYLLASKEILTAIRYRK